MTLDLAIRHRLGSFRLDVAFSAAGRLTAFFGPSGSGKTSLVRAVAGLVRPDEGRIVVDGRTLVDTAHGIWVPAHRRRVGYVFQEARLFPHLSVRQNLAFGRWFAPRRVGPDRTEEIVDLLGIGALLDRRPAKLSGGEQQRVAIGRALLAGPRLLLMDEPLASLDEARRAEILPYIERLRDTAGLPIVYVSHSAEEVARLATDVVLLGAGRAVAVGPPADILRRPDLAGTETSALLGAAVAGDEPDGLTRLTTGAGPLLVPRLGLPAGTRLRARIQARDVMLSTARPTALSAINILPGRVASVSAGDATALIEIACGTERLVSRITCRSVGELGLAPGREVLAIVKSVAVESGPAPGPAA